MGHIVAKDAYQGLVQKIDRMTLRVPPHEALFEVLKRVYTPEEARLVADMPYGLSTLGRISRVTGTPEPAAEKMLDSLCDKGLVLDMVFAGKRRFIPSPLMIGVFEFTMMRAGGVGFGEVARFFHEYIQDGALFAKNLGNGQQNFLMRTLAHEPALSEDAFVEVLPYESAEAIIRSHRKFSIGLCSCRHEKLHVGEKLCDTPLETCSTFGNGADYMIRHKLSREVSKEEMLDNLAQSRELGLVVNADIIRNRPGFFCMCCGCCCNVLQGINRFGYPNAVVTSNFIATPDISACTGCGKCVKACPVNALELSGPPVGKKGKPGVVVDAAFCIGCGVCGVKCPTGAMKLSYRGKRRLLPENTFERVILQCLEQGTLQYQLFDDPSKVSHAVMRGIVGAFLRIDPVKRTLMSEQLRSRFLSMVKKGAGKSRRKAAESV